MGYQIRKIRENDYPILADFLYEAIFIPEGIEKPPKSIIEKPELQVYIADFGKKMIGVWMLKQKKRLWAQCGCVL